MSRLLQLAQCRHSAGAIMHDVAQTKAMQSYYRMMSGRLSHHIVNNTPPRNHRLLITSEKEGDQEMQHFMVNK